MQDRIPPLEMDVSWDGVVVTVTVTGELDVTTAPDLTTRLLQVTAARPERMVLDLSRVVFVDVAGARALDQVHKFLGAECPVVLRGPRPSARRVFGLTGMMKD